jgi:SulP family sulfate permease
MSAKPLADYFPVLQWARTYDGDALSGDLMAALIVTTMLIPQSLAYALLAGLPPEAGIYASIAPIVLYAIFGTSRALVVIVAVLSLVDISILTRSWAYSRADFASVAATILLTLGLGVEAGVSAGVVLSIALHLYKTSRPHIAEVGLVPGTQHFRNIHRHNVLTDPSLLTLRVDESLYFANARYLEDYISGRVASECPIKHVVLMCSAINEIDLSALESLEAINHRLKEMGVKLHLSEVKGPVTDRLKRSHFIDELTGQVFLSQFDAVKTLTPGLSEN